MSKRVPHVGELRVLGLQHRGEADIHLSPGPVPGFMVMGPVRECLCGEAVPLWPDTAYVATVDDWIGEEADEACPSCMDEFRTWISEAAIRLAHRAIEAATGPQEATP
jgi:hypothetical protein